MNRHDQSINQADLRSWIDRHLQVAGWDGDTARSHCPFPGHADRNPSFSVKADRALGTYICHKPGCDGHRGGTLSDLARALGLPWISTGGNGTSKAWPKPDTYHVYHDEKGQAVGRVARAGSGPGKRIWQERPAGGGWEPKAFKPILYRLPDVLKALAAGYDVHVVEGERCADRLAGLGYYATTNPTGAGKWTPAMTQTFLNCASVYIWPDCDTPGIQHAQQVATALAARGCVVRVVELPFEVTPDHGRDVADYLVDHTEQDLVELLKAAPTHRPDLAPKASGPRAVLKPLSSYERRRVEFLWNHRLVRGLNTFSGDPGLGKSTLAQWIAAQISVGAPLPGDDPTEPGDTIILSAEDEPEDTILPRILAAGGDPRRIHILEAVTLPEDEDNPEPRERSVSLEDVGPLAGAIDAVNGAGGKVRLIIVDPTTAYLNGKDGNANHDVRGLLRPVSKLAAQRGVTVLMVGHLNKAQAQALMYRASNSLAFVAASRAVFYVVEDAEDEERPPGERRRLLVPIKTNLSKKPATLAFDVASSPEDPEVPEIIWRGESKAEATDLLSDDEDRAEADKWLPAHLEGIGGSAADILAAAKRDGISERSLRRAKKRLKIGSARDGATGPWTWTLPTKAQVDSPHCHTATKTMWQPGSVGPASRPQNGTNGHATDDLALDLSGIDPAKLAQLGDYGGSG